MPENEYRYVCSVCSGYVGLYGVFIAIRSWSGGYEDTGERVSLVDSNARMRGMGIEDILT